MAGGWAKRIALVIVALLAFAVGFAGAAAGLDMTQPAVRGSTARVQFEVLRGDDTAAVAARLQREGLIRNALVFRALARLRHLDTHIEAGIYDLSPSMSTAAVVARLVTGRASQRTITVPEGLRVTQYPRYFAVLPHFDAARFLKTAASGQLPDGTRLWEAYWYVPKPDAGVPYTLEGYLFPDTYAFDPTADDSAVVRRMLDTLGERLCPGPDAAHLDAYLHDAAQCKAHEARLGASGPGLFERLEDRYFTSDDAAALRDALILGSLAIREIAKPTDAPGVVNVFYNRYLVAAGKLPASDDHPGYLGSDPSAEYARDTLQPPADGHWWAELADAGAKTAPASPYNADVTTQLGLIPGPIAAPGWAELAAAANPNADGPTTAFFFVTDHCGTPHYAATLSAFQADAQRAVDQKQCWTT
ncbi:MAG TPA: endolytic transglycosylase MltG [Ktedonobacterales bacterium]|nr:endolytic transglycosylase MltG [Ktedonobacterales bacterium]